MYQSTITDNQHTSKITAVQLAHENLYYPRKLNTYNSEVPHICTKCETEKGSLFHCLWQCDQIKMSWEAGCVSRTYYQYK